MSKTWIVVGHDAGARIFERRGIGKGLELVDELDNPGGRDRDGDFDADRPGRSFRRNAGDPRRSAFSRAESPRERVVADFARRVANTLGQARTEQRFGQLVLVAPPRFLGLLRASLDSPTARSVIGSLDKDFAAHGEAELAVRLADVIAI